MEFQFIVAVERDGEFVAVDKLDKSEEPITSHDRCSLILAAAENYKDQPVARVRWFHIGYFYYTTIASIHRTPAHDVSILSARDENFRTFTFKAYVDLSSDTGSVKAFDRVIPAPKVKKGTELIYENGRYFKISKSLKQWVEVSA
jgi:hypothetical protein